MLVHRARPDNETPQQRSDSTGGSSSDSIRGVSSVQTDSAQDIANNQEIILKDSSFHSNEEKRNNTHLGKYYYLVIITQSLVTSANKTEPISLVCR